MLGTCDTKRSLVSETKVGDPVRGCGHAYMTQLSKSAVDTSLLLCVERDELVVDATFLRTKTPGRLLN
jgi:hypothetical protein